MALETRYSPLSRNERRKLFQMYFALTRDVVLALGQYSSEISKEAREERRLWCFRPEIIYCFPCCELQIFGRRTVIARLHAVNSLWRSSKEREFLFAALPVSLQSALEKGSPSSRQLFHPRKSLLKIVTGIIYRLDWGRDRSWYISSTDGNSSKEWRIAAPRRPDDRSSRFH